MNFSWDIATADEPQTWIAVRDRVQQAFGRCYIRDITEFRPFTVDGVPLLTYLKGRDLAAVQTWGLFLAGVETQTETICMAAIQENPRALLFVKHQTPALCLAAVSADGWVLPWVREQTPTICYAATCTRESTSLLAQHRESAVPYAGL
jgi:hypothetical protein